MIEEYFTEKEIELMQYPSAESLMRIIMANRKLIIDLKKELEKKEFACIIDSIGRRREKKIDKKLEEMEGEE